MAVAFTNLSSYFFEILNNKTTCLFSFSSTFGAIQGALSNPNIDEGEKERNTNLLTEIGTDFGIAYQLRDDVLAIIGSSIELGKPPDSDIVNRIQSLIVLESLRLGSKAEQELILNYYINNAEDIPLTDVRATLISSGGVKSTVERCLFHRNRAISNLKSFPNGAAKERYIDLLSRIGFEGLKY